MSELTALIQHGPWPVAQQNALIMALSTSLHSGSTNASKDKRTPQELWHFQNYTIASEKETLCDPRLAMTVKVTKALDVCERIGAVLLKEVCKKHVLSTVCAAHLMGLQESVEMQGSGTDGAPPPHAGWTPQELRSWLLYFKGQYTTRFKNKHADPAIGHIIRYHDKPTAFDEVQFRNMFGAAEVVPLPINSDILTRLQDNVWCRKHATALKDTSQHGTNCVDMQVRNTSAPQVQPNPMAQMMQMMMTAMQQGMNMNMNTQTRR